MKQHIGSFEQTIAAVRGLSEHRLKRSMTVVPCRRRGANRPKSTSPLNIGMAIRLGWCTPPVAMRPTTDADYARITREMGL